MGNFAGGRLAQVNTTRDGVVVSDGRYGNGAFSTTYTSPDLVDEVRVIVAPADAETSRGSGQVQMTTRSGTNQVRGSLFWSNNNTLFGSNNWFNNFNGVPRDYENQNQFGGRIGGPIIKNKTFFFFLFEGQRFIERAAFTGTVLTAQARQGIFRSFPGVNNGNVFSSNPTVDVSGNPVSPVGATGPLQSFSVFGRDPNRTGIDTTWMQATIRRMPLPNNFTVGDGLNTAGIQWVRRFVGVDLPNGNGEQSNRNQYNLRLDHTITARHKFFLSGTLEQDNAMTSQAGPPNWPNGFDGLATRDPDVLTVSLVSTLSPSLLNEFRAGRRRSVQRGWAPYDRPDAVRAAALATMPKYNGIPALVSPVEFAQNFISTAGAGSTRSEISPLYTITDTLSWTKGRHAFKGGVEFRFEHSDAWNTPSFIPVVALGAGSVAVTGINGTVIPGLTGANQTAAQNLLIDLSGSVSSVQEGYTVPSAQNLKFEGYPQLTKNASDWHQNESSAFFKDDWKVRSALTVNLGVRWEYYGVPYSGVGKMVRPVGGSSGLWGISGSGYGAMYQPGLMDGSLTTVELAGKNSQQPGQQLYKDEWTNFSPAVGLSWSVPWFGKDKTVLRAGYAINYTGSIQFYSFDTALNRTPGIFQYTNYTPGTYLSLANIPLPLPPVSQPLQPVPLTDRTQTIESFDNSRVDPYIQNWNLGIQHQLAGGLTVEARYIGSKGTKLWGGIPLNDVNIFENGILNAFNITRAGGNAPLFDQMLRGLNFGLGAVNGTTVTGSASLRQNTTTRAFVANGNVGGLANFLNTTPTGTDVNGGLLQNGGLPQNFIVVNPQSPASAEGPAAEEESHWIQIRAIQPTMQWNFWSRNVCPMALQLRPLIRGAEAWAKTMTML